MKPEQPDPLWDPQFPADSELARLQTLLGRYRHVRRQDSEWNVTPVPARQRWHRFALVAAAVLVGVTVAGTAWLPWRLQWSENRQWEIQSNAEVEPASLQVGRILATSSQQTATLQVARIGRMEVLPGTRVRLAETRSGHHRVELLEGRLRARIWAPPGYFGVSTGGGEMVDLGCAFEMYRNGHGEGGVQVSSGWVMYRVNGQETLVPEGYGLQFNARRSGIPFAAASSSELRATVEQLDLALAEGRRVPMLEQALAEQAATGDRFTLLSLLTRYPALASGPLYLRLSAMFGEREIDQAHRQAWQQGSVHAMNLWWERIPRPAKAWWLNWRDAFG